MSGKLLDYYRDDIRMDWRIGESNGIGYFLHCCSGSMGYGGSVELGICQECGEEAPPALQFIYATRNL